MSPPRVSSHSPETDSSPSKKLSSPLQINGIKQLNGHIAIEPYKISGFVPEDRNNKLNELLSSVVRSETLYISNKIAANGDEEKIEENQQTNGEVSAEDGKAPSATTTTKDKVIARLESLLTTANQELRLRDEEVARLTSIRTAVEAELEELTASLFQVKIYHSFSTKLFVLPVLKMNFSNVHATLIT
jgi:hypothetical protein